MTQKPNATAAAKRVFGRALEIDSPAERAAYLDQACGADNALRTEVEQLLEAHDQAGSFLNHPPAAEMPTLISAPMTEGPGTVIGGRYKLLQQIGEGGMGVVYMAEQTEPIRRKVALKVIKPGMDTTQVVARFEAERQALALMEHQNIARVLDAGTVGPVCRTGSDARVGGDQAGGIDQQVAAREEQFARQDRPARQAGPTGRPFFVMELVKGAPITQYCDRNRLTLRARLELFTCVCHAIQHAHQKGIIHRDIKPSNVLVCLYDGRPVPKVIDFGVAKAIQQPLVQKTLFTQFGQIVGTLEYMSPEQAELNQLDVDTRSDVYSLGVLLYELLTGTTPITHDELAQTGFPGALMMIREREPETPSLRLDHAADTLPEISAQRRVEPRKLPGLVRGELDWIVMKALEKDRTRRYATAADLARDVERHLADDPVEACPPSAGYKLRKWSRKHRASLAVAASFLFLLLAGAAVSAAQAVRATRAEGQATAERDHAVAAKQQARRQRDEAQQARDREAAARREAEAAREQAQDSLCRSLYEQARAVRLAGAPGRRWKILDLLKRAEMIRTRPRSVNARAATGTQRNGQLPAQAQLRTEAVAAILLRDGRVARQWSGQFQCISPDGEFAARTWADREKGQTITSLIELATGNLVDQWSGAPGTIASRVVALGPGGKKVLVHSISRGPRSKSTDIVMRPHRSAACVRPHRPIPKGSARSSVLGPARGVGSHWASPGEQRCGIDETVGVCPRHPGPFTKRGHPAGSEQPNRL